jgi:two-component system cell cycle sensor histidine kinase/response regulator CckA
VASYLPVAAPTSSDDGSAETEGPQEGDWLGDGRTILVAEDETQVRAVVERILSSAGYDVVAFGCPRQALDEYARRLGEFDLLLTDVVMPEMSGAELSEKTGLPTVFMSGHAEIGLPGVADLREVDLVIDKPFSKESLLEAVLRTSKHRAIVASH